MSIGADEAIIDDDEQLVSEVKHEVGVGAIGGDLVSHASQVVLLDVRLGRRALIGDEQVF